MNTPLTQVLSHHCLPHAFDAGVTKDTQLPTKGMPHKTDSPDI